MADGTVGVAQSSTPDRQIDNELIGTVYRQRTRLGGAALAELAAVANTTPAGTEYALLTRNIPSGTQTVTVSNMIAAGETGLAKDGTDGTSPPAVLGSGTGIRGWLRSIYEKLTGSIAVTGTFWQATQPVSLATNTPDVTDRSARLLGHVTVDSAPTTAVTGPLTDTQLRATRVPVDGSGVTQPVSGTFWQATQPVSGTVTSNIGSTNGLALDATLTGGTAKAVNRGGAKGSTAAADVTSAAVDANTQALHVNLAGTQATVPVTGTFWQGTQPVSLATNTPDVTDRAARLLGHVTVDSAPTTAVTGTFWQATQPVSIAATVTTKETRAATPTQSSVAASATNVTLLAANANRLGATVYNDDTASVLSLKLGVTASATSFTLKVAAGGYYEVPFGYTGQIDGLWSVASGNARITELTA